MNSKKLERISDINKDFDKWYVDVVKHSQLMDYGLVKGTMIIKPYGWAIWENVQKEMNQKFKNEGVENLALPLFIPVKLIDKEVDHIDGFAPEILKVTHCGDRVLEEPFYIRPTSEALFMQLFKKEVKTYKSLPLIYNQWCSVVRWEKRTKPFLRSSEFFWQEGHTIHSNEQEAKDLVQKILHHYKSFCEDILAMPVFVGEKSVKERFAGALKTYSIEAMMKNGKALQAATSHYFGTKFSQAFDIKFQNKQNQLEYGYTTSWGISTRIIGALIMVHGDEKGLVMPPRIAPIEVIILPILGSKNNDTVLSKVKDLELALKDFRIKTDYSDKSLGFKSASAEIKGIPLRIEVGPRDLEKNQIVIVKRINNEKKEYQLSDNIPSIIKKLLNEIHQEMYDKALKNKESKTYEVNSLSEFETQIKKGYVLAPWCLNGECEEKVKTLYKATTRCIDNSKTTTKKCVICNNQGKVLVYFALAY